MIAYCLAWDLVGDHSWIAGNWRCKLKGGRAFYDGAEITNNDNVKLWRLDGRIATPHVITRYVKWDTPIELVLGGVVSDE